MQVFKNNVSLEATPASDTHIVNKAYLEDRISKINVQHAVKVDELPICTDNGDGTYTITYIKDGDTKTTTDISQWFYYLDDNGNLKQTVFLEGEELTIDGTEIALDDYVEKSAIVTTLDDTATDEQVPSALAVYNAIKDKNMKTYTSARQLGLSFPCTTGELFLAMPDNSIIMHNVDALSDTISDVPIAYGLLAIYKKNEGRFRITYTPSTSTSISKNRMWIGQLKGSDGSGLIWNEVCTTSVANFYNSEPKFTSESNYKIADAGNAYIECKNGWVFVNLPYVNVVSPTSNITTLIKGLPKPRKGFWGETPPHVGAGNEALQYGIDVTGTFQLERGSTGVNYRVVFSYPVAES